MTAVAETLGVSRSNLAERRARGATPRRPSAKPDDAGLLPDIRALVDQRPSYGYRRITALLNRERRARGLSHLNAKRVLRIMRQHGLTLQAHTGRRPGRTHDGVVIALRSDIRWCSDHFELHCRSGEVVRVLFAIDACDREIIAWSAVVNGGVSGEMVRDLMLACVERRFEATHTPHPVEWLSDNGSAYIAKDTADMATALGLTLAFTPPRSPESNGMAEAFVKTFRRDYLRCAILVDALFVLDRLPEWFNDYNAVHPHAVLRYLSPAEFRAQRKSA
jgi:transposase InsO family protein